MDKWWEFPALAGICLLVLLAVEWYQRPNLEKIQAHLIEEGWVRLQSNLGSTFDCKVRDCKAPAGLKCPGITFTVPENAR